ncbi:lysylphosphatidylglycerol synthase transmembrane domain-containing protein [Tundrisphaera lichenicola]|uniref:lysylphosphatidylglycerol synthase transmembrane domain-containing protein n=1 Tax=Tundrisphaera lichenicola TaxID=2029860 RepID=UPI003EB7597B
MTPPSSHRRSLLLNLILVLVAFGLLALVVSSNREKIAEVFRKPVDYRLFGLGLLIYLSALMLSFVRWHQLVRAQGLIFSLRDAIRLGFIGNVFNLVIPGAVGGDVIKAAFLCRMQPEKKPQAVASMVLDRLLGLLGLFILAAVAGAFAWPSAELPVLAESSGDLVPPSSRQLRILIGLVWFAVASGLIGLGVVFSPSLYRPLNRLVAGRGKLERIVRELEAIGLAYRQRLGVVVGMLGAAILGHSLFVVAFYSASKALFSDLPTLGQHFLLVPLALFTTAIPLPFGALGLSEGISGQLFLMVRHTEGAIAMMAFRILMYGNGAISALVYLANLRQVRTIAKEAEPIFEEAIEATIVEPTARTEAKRGETFNG